MFSSKFLLSVFITFYFAVLVHSFALPAGGATDPVDEVDLPTPEPADPVDIPNDDGSETPVLIGDLAKTGPTTPIGTSIAGILLGKEAGMSAYTEPAPKGGPTICKQSKDTCCVWYSISNDLTSAFKGPSGRCNDMARAAIRLGFHDAGTWSKKLADAGQDYGGADGSFVLFGEIARKENKGLEAVTILAAALKLKYKSYGITMADLIQYMANHAVVTCPLGPRVRTYVGRKDATRASIDGLLPPVTGSADSLIALFQDKTISPHDLVALLGAHSTSKQFSVSKPDFAEPQDSTPGVWDVLFYNETIRPQTNKKVFRFASDFVISQDPRTKGEWDSFIGDQHHWNEDYAKAYVRLSLLGVNVINSLTECTKTLPAARLSFAGSAETLIDQKRVRRDPRSIIGEEAKRGGCTGFKA